MTASTSSISTDLLMPNAYIGSRKPSIISGRVFSLKSCFLDSEFEERERKLKLQIMNLKREKEETVAKYEQALKKLEEMEVIRIGWEDKCKIHDGENGVIKRELLESKDQNTRLRQLWEDMYENLKAEYEESEKCRRNMNAEHDLKDKEVKGLAEQLEEEKIRVREKEIVAKGLAEQLEEEKRRVREKEIEAKGLAEQLEEERRQMGIMGEKCRQIEILLKRNEILETEKKERGEDFGRKMKQKEDDIPEPVKKNEATEAEKRELEGEIMAKLSCVEEHKSNWVVPKRYPQIDATVPLQIDIRAPDYGTRVMQDAGMNNLITVLKI